jgi:hypothetical protein
MRLRVLRPLSGSVDGIDLTQFKAGSVYSFSTAIASFLLAIGAAEPVVTTAPSDSKPRSQELWNDRRQSSAPRVQWTGLDRRRNKR